MRRPISPDFVSGNFADMTCLARMVVSGLPHHVTQRGNRREPLFFEDGDQEIYRDLLGEQTRKAVVEVWASCLMPNHVHLILNPRQADGLGRNCCNRYHVDAFPSERLRSFPDVLLVNGLKRQEQRDNKFNELCYGF